MGQCVKDMEDHIFVVREVRHPRNGIEGLLTQLSLIWAKRPWNEKCCELGFLQCHEVLGDNVSTTQACWLRDQQRRVT